MFSLDFTANILYEFDYENLYVYNVLTLIEFNILFFLYKKLSHEPLTQKLIRIGLPLFNLIWLSSTIFYIVQGQFWKYNPVSAASGSILVSLVLVLFFREMLVSNKILNYKKDLSFWISFGLLVYYLGTTPVASLLNFLSKHSKITIYDFTSIQFYLSVFMQSCFIFGILWSQKKAK
jgi:hypothetical protein